ncbi:MAG: Xaa-Pro dipeptidyl-peptidase [Bdellovibrionales bacterium]|nr:Xaa-Pro dipeptidyl-peptidase [Bdellovibrionales bacterium]
MKLQLAMIIGLFAASAFGGNSNLVEQEMLSEVVYVESPTDTDGDGKLDRIYVSIDRPSSDKKLSSIFSISPYALGGNDGPMHNVDMDLLPQDEKLFKGLSANVKNLFSNLRKTLREYQATPMINAFKYAQVRAHSVGTGKSTGCPTVGDMAETLAAKSVIDWLDGRARAFSQDGREVKADWANGSVGMTGTSYDGTLPIMVATTGVEGLKAIIPIAAISNWYDYYRANGLVVNPGGYVGEDADSLGFFIMRKGDCKAELANITKTMGRENGDFTSFWQARDHLAQVKNIKAATFIIHGQSDWNVKQKHAIQLWEALEGVAPRRMFLHRGGHGSTYNHGVPKKIQAWFDHFLEGEENGITSGPQVEVELTDGSLMVQNEWPNESTESQRLFFMPDSSLAILAADEDRLSITDSGQTQELEKLTANPGQRNEGRLVFLTAPLEMSTVLSGTSRVSLNLAVLNRKAANITVAIVEYDKNNRAKIITRGWADPQNHQDFTQGETLIPGQIYQLSFDLEPKQYRLAAGSRLGVLLASTDYDYTLRPKSGTKIEFTLGQKSFIDLRLSK